MNFIALDPGKENVWGAKFVGTECTQIKIFDPEKIELWERNAWPLVVVEKPSILNVPNTADMAEVLWSGAIVASALSDRIIAYSPSSWKGNMKKPVHHKRVIECMTADELSLLPEEVPVLVDQACRRLADTGRVTKYNHFWHNYLDAIGIGMYHLRRIRRGGTKGPTNVET